MSRTRLPNLDDVRFFVDEDLAGLGLALMGLRNDVVVGGHPPICELVPRKDSDWIPVVAARDWVVITNDRHIRTRPVEAQVAVQNRLRCVHLDPTRKDAIRWDFLRLLVSHWDAVERVVHERGPVWLKLRGDRTRRLDYRPCEPPLLPHDR